MTYRIAGIDVHKRMLAVVVADVAVDGGYQFDRRTFGTAPEQLRQLAARQRSLANQMERLNESGVPGNPQQMAEEARQLADRIEQARLDRATLERQQRLFRRMLDAGRSLRNDDQPEDPERRSRTGEAAQGRAPTDTARPGTLRYPPPSWNDLRDLPPAERAMVLDYFRRLNATPR